MIDPVTVEIIQNRLTQIGREAGISMVRAAASLIVVGAKDFGFNIADDEGRTVVYSIWMPRHGTTLSFMLKSCLKKFKGEDIFPGDMFMVNNPHDGALHVLDIAILSPVHFKGKIVAWTACATHQLDLRAMRPGFTPDATDWFQEGIIFRPIKIMEKGKIKDDIFNFLMDNVRVPRLQGLDLKAQIAANNVAKEKIINLVERYGTETLKACYDEIIRFSEIKTRERIREITPGSYEAVDYLDYDRVYKACCTLIVKEDTLVFDFTGTDPQSGTYINSALACTIANVHNIISCMLVPDVTSNEGCFRPISFVLPEGGLLSCKPPAPCSGASTIGGWKAQILAIKVLSKAFANSPTLAWRANAVWGWGWVGLTPAGLDQYGKPFVTTFMSSVLQGGGARATRDGFDVANIAGSTNTSVPNVEDKEYRYPFLFLNRGMVRDSGGAGKYRGGVSGELAIKVHDVGSVDCFLGYVGKEIESDGFAGGKGGKTSEVSIKRNTNVNELLHEDIPSFNEILGEKTVLPQQNPPFKMGPDDVLYMRCQGGGGYGNPAEREINMVGTDVKEDYVSPEAAEKYYAAVIKPETGEVDKDKTAALRKHL
ncbi:MAG: hydantoinase B/oxoprolinase family protein [Dehalococcoidia bacterium]|nr:hydantoinase B/oxoprolinase family protein [Dehalococcoidia bacterium]MDZ4245791.1 hydantoinase B/oxoprolinase family protein [Dehalococcoidia bacterium]